MAAATMTEELICPVCLEFYTDPRLLPCHHSLCKACLLALRSNKNNASDCELQCPSCRHIFYIKDETQVESLPKNFTLASIVCKFQESVKGDRHCPCDICEEGQKGRAIKKCLQCQLNYCRMCLEHLHPKKGALANHKLVPLMNSLGENREADDAGSDFLPSLSTIQSVGTQKYDQLHGARYCTSCDEIYTKGDQTSGEGNHDTHNTTETRLALKKKREDLECMLARYLDQEHVLEKRLADTTSFIQILRKRVEEKKTELVQRFGELAEKAEKRKILAESRIEEEMKMRITSLESHLRELADLKSKTRLNISACFELVNLTNDDPITFLMKLKKLQNEFGLYTGDYIEQTAVLTECASSVPVEKIMSDIISKALQDFCPSERKIQTPDTKPVVMDISPKRVNMAIKVTNVQKEGTISANVHWLATDQADRYQVSYLYNPNETVVLKQIAVNECKLANLRWDSTYTIKVTAQLKDGQTVYDEQSFKTDPKVKSIMDISPERMNMAIEVTNVQIAGTMSADVKWCATNQQVKYDVGYSCSPHERVWLTDVTENSCRLKNLRWDSAYTVKVTTQLIDGKKVFDTQSFKTDPEVKCFPMAIAEVCNKKIIVMDSLDEFIASDRFLKDISSKGKEEFSGIVLTPVLTEQRHFWTMNMELTIFEKRCDDETFLEFGIIDCSHIDDCSSLSMSDEAYSCSISKITKTKFHLQFHNRFCIDNRSYPLPLKLFQKAHFSYSFLYDRFNREFAIMDCQSQEVLHVFDVHFKEEHKVVFAICPFHTELKMRIKTKFDYIHCTLEDVSCWMRKIDSFKMINFGYLDLSD